MTTLVARCPQPDTPIVYSARWIPLTRGPWYAGWTTSRDSTVAVAAGHCISKRARFRAVWTAISCLLSRNWPWLTQPATVRPAWAPWV